MEGRVEVSPLLSISDQAGKGAHVRREIALVREWGHKAQPVGQALQRRALLEAGRDLSASRWPSST